jgi:hypothetical protein
MWTNGWFSNDVASELLARNVMMIKKKEGRCHILLGPEE